MCSFKWNEMFKLDTNTSAFFQVRCTDQGQVYSRVKRAKETAQLNPG